MIVFALNIMPSSSINDNKRITKCHNNRNYNTYTTRVKNP